MQKDLVYLVQTDTTVGFSSFDDEKLSNIKQRPKNQKILQTVDSFKTLKEKTRIPKEFRKKVRRANKTTFIYPSLKSFRVVQRHSDFFSFIDKFSTLYSTSANLNKSSFDYDFAYKHSDIIVFSKDGFIEKSSSNIYKVNKKKIIKIR